MSDAEGQQEPTMEEILASIRRIITEDGEAVEASDEEVLVLDETEEDKPEELVEGGIMELEEGLEPEREIEPVFILAEEEPEDEVFDLTEVLDEDEELEPLVLDEVIEDEPEFEPEPIYGTVPEYELEPDPYIAGPATMPTAEPEGLVSQKTAEQTAAAFVDFASAVSSAQGVQLGATHRTMEELVKNLLRPMLKDWLDNNLQSIVSQTVEREIAKLAGRAGED